MPSHDPSSSSDEPVWVRPHLDLRDDKDDMADEDIDRYREMSFDDAIDEVNVRFMINLDSGEMTPLRLYFAAELGHWFYEDFMRPVNPYLPNLSQKQFAQQVISSNPIFADLTDDEGRTIDYDAIWTEYLFYKQMVPTCGVILVNRQGTKCLLVRGWTAKSSWVFPRGKINENESEVSCAIRELEEETGFDCSRMIDPRAKYQTEVRGQSVTMFFVTGVDEHTAFEPRTRNEIGAISWVKLNHLPTWDRKRDKAGKTSRKKMFNVVPFVAPLKRFLKDKGVLNARADKASMEPAAPATLPYHASSHHDTRLRHSLQANQAKPTTQATAMDRLFADFIGKQGDPSRAKADNQTDLDRLFGNLNVGAQTQSQKQDPLPASDDDALAKLLGAIGPSATPAPDHRQEPPPTAGQSKLLAVLNRKTTPPPPQHSQHAMANPRQASLLAVLSSEAPHRTHVSTPSDDGTIHGKPTSLPTSPRPSSPGEAERKNKQRALLEMTVAGIGLDSVSPRQSDSGPSYSHSQSDYQAPLPGSYGNQPRVTPPQPYAQQYRPPAPAHQPPSFAPPPGTYYSSSSQPPVGQPNSGGGPSPGRNRGAPPPYESHFGGPPGPSRPPPHTVLMQNSHLADFTHHHHPPVPQTMGNYAPRPPPSGPAPGLGQSYRPHQPVGQSYLPNSFQQPPFGAAAQPHQQAFFNGPGNAAPYQPPPPRPPMTQPYQPPPKPPPMPPPHATYHGQASGNGPAHTGQMHQPIPRNGPQTGMLLDMLNEGRGR